MTGPARLEFATSSDGTRIVSSATGTGPTLLHLPGVPFSNLEVEWQVPVLARAYERLTGAVRLVQFDGRGTGRSQRDVVDLSLDAMLRDIDAVVASRGLRRFALLGFYNSVPHAIAYAARHPDRVSHLILFGGSARGWDPMGAAGTQALLSLIEHDWDTFVESAAHAWLGWAPEADGRLAAEWFRTATTPAVARATLQATSGIDVTDDVGHVRCPVLVLHRRSTSVIPLDVSSALAASFPDGRLELLEGRSASLFFEDADAVVDRIVRFVTGQAVAATGAGSAGGRSVRPQMGVESLTTREREVLRHIAAGQTNAQIATDLGITENTVERHVTNLYRKIDARGRADATAVAIRTGLA